MAYDYARRGPRVPFRYAASPSADEKRCFGMLKRKPAAIRSHEVVDCFDDDLDCLIAGIHFDANLRVFKIYLMSTTIAAGDNGVGHVSGCPWLPEFAA